MTATASQASRSSLPTLQDLRPSLPEYIIFDCPCRFTVHRIAIPLATRDCRSPTLSRRHSSGTPPPHHLSYRLPTLSLASLTIVLLAYGHASSTLLTAAIPTIPACRSSLTVAFFCSAFPSLHYWSFDTSALAAHTGLLDRLFSSWLTIDGSGLLESEIHLR